MEILKKKSRIAVLKRRKIVNEQKQGRLTSIVNEWNDDGKTNYFEVFLNNLVHSEYF